MKILFAVTSVVDIGGISTSLSNLLSAIAADNNITVCALNNYISPNKYIPLSVSIVPGSEFLEDCFINRNLMNHQNMLRKVARMFRRSFRVVFGRQWAIQKGVSRLCINESYDIAIAFTTDEYDKAGNLKNGGCFDFIKNNVKAKKKIAWIHNDARECGYTPEICRRIFDGFDAIINVSAECKQIFDGLSPETILRSKVVYNLYNIDEIQQKAGTVSPFENNGKIHFVTVARLKNQQKRLDRIVTASERLIKEGYTNFDWSIVGDGPDREELLSEITKRGLTEVVVLMGLKPNPYPYMKFADAFVLSSQYEGYGMTIKEAQILGTPALVTNFGAAYETVADKKNGLICDNSSEGVYNLVREILSKPDLLKQYRQYLQSNPVTNDVALDQFYGVCRI